MIFGTSHGLRTLGQANIVRSFEPIHPGTVRPEVSSVPSTLRVGETGKISGVRFTTPVMEGGENLGPSPEILPWVVFVPHEGGASVVFPMKTWTDTDIEFEAAATTWHGPGWLHVMVQGVPSHGRPFMLQPRLDGGACRTDGECEHGFCVEGVCCNARCGAPCRSCLSANTAASDGECAEIVRGVDPKEACEDELVASCGLTGVCDGAGECEKYAENAVCDVDRLCRGGSCALTMGANCDSTRDCAKGQACSEEGVCVALNPAAVVLDGGCAVTAPHRDHKPWWAFLGLLAASAALRRRRARAPRSGRPTSVLLLTLAVTACGDERIEASPELERDAGGAADAIDALDAPSSDAVSDAPQGSPLSVFVSAYSLEIPSAVYGAPAVAGASLLLVDGAGARFEAQTDDFGEARFDAVEWENGPICLTAYREDLTVTSLVGVAQTPSVGLALADVAPPERVQLTGSAAGMTNSSHYLMVNASKSGYSRQAGAAFAFPVPKGEAFSLLGLEFSLCMNPCSTCVCKTFHAWNRTEVEALSGPADVVLDMTDRLVPVTGSVTFVLPERVDSPLRDKAPYAQISSHGGLIAHGFTTKCNQQPFSINYTCNTEYVA